MVDRQHVGAREHRPGPPGTVRLVHPVAGDVQELVVAEQRVLQGDHLDLGVTVVDRVDVRGAEGAAEPSSDLSGLVEHPG